jgi:hypothetical protein
MCSTALFSQTGAIFRRRVVFMRFLTLDSYCSGGIGGCEESGVMGTIGTGTDR